MMHSENAGLIHFLEENQVKPTVIVFKNKQKVDELLYIEIFISFDLNWMFLVVYHVFILFQNARI